MDQQTIWIIAIVALAVGVLIGYLMGKSGGSDAQRKVLEEELKGSRAEMDRYKEEVTTHFEHTAALVNDLTDQYRKVHQHLATGAQNLCPDQQPGRSLQSSLQPKLESKTDDLVADAPDTDETAVTEPTQQETQETQETAPEAAKTPEDTDSNYEAPKDWAPKKPDDEGTLSDSYGLKKSGEEAPTPPQPDPGLHEEASEKKPQS